MKDGFRQKSNNIFLPRDRSLWITDLAEPQNVLNTPGPVYYISSILEWFKELPHVFSKQ